MTRRLDPPMTATEREALVRRRVQQGALLTSTGKRSRRRGELTPEAKRAKDAVYRARKSGRLVVPPTCPECSKPLDPSEAEFSHDSYDGDGLRGRFMHAGCHRRLDRANPRGGCRR